MDEIEEENGQDIIDPWGIVNKPLRVSSQLIFIALRGYCVEYNIIIQIYP